MTKSGDEFAVFLSNKYSKSEGHLVEVEYFWFDYADGGDYGYGGEFFERKELHLFAKAKGDRVYLKEDSEVIDLLHEYFGSSGV